MTIVRVGVKTFAGLLSGKEPGLTVALIIVSMGRMGEPHKRLAKWRGKKGLSKTATAEMFGCDPTYIGGLESGKRLPGRAIANRIKKLVGIPTEAWDRAGAS